jgi:hypothetical protein
MQLSQARRQLKCAPEHLVACPRFSIGASGICVGELNRKKYRGNSTEGAGLRPAAGLWTFSLKQVTCQPAPQRGNAYQPRVKPRECHAPTSTRSEGTPHSAALEYTWTYRRQVCQVEISGVTAARLVARWAMFPGCYPAPLLACGVPLPTRVMTKVQKEKTRASCLDLTRILQDEVVVHSQLLPSQATMTE